MQWSNLSMQRRAERLAIALAGLLVVWSSLAAAQGPGKPDTGRGDRDDWASQRWERMAERLELTLGQQQAILEIREETQTRNREIRTEILRLENELDGVLLADKIDEGKVLKLVEEIGGARTEIKKNQMHMRLAIAEKLTPEQREQWRLFKDNRSRVGRSGGDRWHGRGRGAGRCPHGCAGMGCDGNGPHGRPGAECDGKGPHGRAARK